ncbi:Uncharacterized protein Rs2_18434 [Raphanus sativus]|nr:Uncharacterized protein Rs2_18434 [Raphanus sativus]
MTLLPLLPSKPSSSSVISARIVVATEEAIETRTRPSYGRRAGPAQNDALSASTFPIPLIRLTPIPPMRARRVNERSRRHKKHDKPKKAKEKERSSKSHRHKRHKNRDKKNGEGEGSSGPVKLSKFLGRDKDDGEHRSAVSGKKIMLKVDKSKVDKAAESKRNELFKFLNASFD